jgi:hypothetical protein
MESIDEAVKSNKMAVIIRPGHPGRPGYGHA